MAQVTRTTAKGYFNTGDTPTEANFADLIDSALWYDEGAGAEVAFNTAIPFNSRQTIMNTHTMVADIALTVNSTGALNGAETVVQIISDGTHTVDISAFMETTGSNAMNNDAGILNLLVFKKIGTNYWVTIMQESGAIAVDTVAPVLSTATVHNAQHNVIEFKTDEDIDQTSIPSPSAFTATGSASGAKTATDVNIIAQDKFEVVFDEVFEDGETITCTYTQPGSNQIKDDSGNLMASFITGSGGVVAVTNNVSNDLLQFIPANWNANGVNGYIATAGGWVAWSGQPIHPGHGMIFTDDNDNADVGDIRIGFLDDVPYGSASYGNYNHYVQLTFEENIVTQPGGLNGTFTRPGTNYFKLEREAGTGDFIYSRSTDGTNWTEIFTMPSAAGTWYIGIELAAVGVGFTEMSYF